MMAAGSSGPASLEDPASAGSTWSSWAWNWIFGWFYGPNITLVDCLNELVPVRARRQISYPLDKLGENAPAKRVLEKQELYALNHINRKLALEPKVR